MKFIYYLNVFFTRKLSQRLNDANKKKFKKKKSKTRKVKYCFPFDIFSRKL